MDLAFAPDRRAYVLDWQNHRVRRVNADDTFETVLGTGDVGDGPDHRRRAHGPRRRRHRLQPEPPDRSDLRRADGTGRPRRLAQPQDPPLRSRHRHGRGAERRRSRLHGRRHAGDGRAAEPAEVGGVSHATGAIYLADTRNFRVRRIGSDGVSTPWSAARQAGFAGDGGPPARGPAGLPDGERQPRAGRRRWRSTIQDRLYIADTENQRIRRVDFAANTIETVAGNGTAGFWATAGPRPRRRSPGRATSRSAPTAASSSRTPTTTGCAPVDLGDGRHHDVRGRAATRPSAATASSRPRPRCIGHGASR